MFSIGWNLPTSGILRDWECTSGASRADSPYQQVSYKITKWPICKKSKCLDRLKITQLGCLCVLYSLPEGHAEYRP